MKIKFKGEFSPLILLLVGGLLVFMALGYIAFPKAIYAHGLSYGVRLQLPFSSTGRIVHQTVTKKTKSLEGKYFYASAGDQIILSREVDLEEGRVYHSFRKYRFWPPGKSIWHELVDSSTSDTVEILIEEDGFYRFGFSLWSFQGNVDFAWEKNRIEFERQTLVWMRP
jgi:hypothetical protein